ncbi:MAG TPA: MFS transporter [Streptosporangiaceae bacterium]|jgi:EmrB/QacA subfamily drug resistance transporter
MSESAVAVPGGAQSSGPGEASSLRWWILGVVGLAQLMVVLDATVVNIALPSAQHALGFSNADRQWVVTAYSLAFGSLLLLGGRLSDLIGRRWMLIIGLIGFAAASALGGASTGFAMLVIARGLQGAAGAMLAPAALSTLTTTFTDPAERGKAFGVYGAIAGAGGAVGLLLGGVLTEYLSWRWCLYINVILAVVAVAGAARLLERHPRDPDVYIDWPGAALVVAGLVAVVYGLSEAETKGWGAPTTDTLLPVGVILLAIFVMVERRVAHPLLPLRIVLSRFRGGAYLAIGLSATGMFGIFLFLTYYLQEILHYSPVITGVAFLPMVAALMLSSTTSSGYLMPRFGPRPLVPVGLIVAAGGLVILATQLGLHTSYPGQILPALIVIGLGLGTVFGCAMNTATYGADRADAGVASALVNTNQQVGGSIGTALLNTIAASALTSYLVAHATGDLTSPILLLVQAQAAVHSYVVAFWVSAGIFAGAAVVCGLVLASGTLALTAPPAAPAVTVREEEKAGREGVEVREH